MGDTGQGGLGEQVVQLINKHFGTLKDPRVRRTRRHSLLNVLIMALCGVIGGAEGWKELAAFARARREWFATFLDMPHGTPSADTFRRVFGALKPQAFEACFRAWVQGLTTSLRGEVVAVDGKSVRGALGKELAESPLHLVHVWASEQRLLLGQAAVKGAPGELAAIPELLGQLEVRGAVVTVDANGCTAKVAQAVVESEADYVLHLKGNRSSLHEEIKERFASVRAGEEGAEVDSYCHTEDRGHGRHEIRQAWAVRLDPAPASAHRWPKLKTAVMLKRERFEKGKCQVEWHYYLSSLQPQARKLARVIRSHWSVENHLHWSLDVCFGEDTRRIREHNGAQNFALLNRIALTLLRRETTAKPGLPCRRKQAGWDPDYLLRVLLSGIPEN